MPIDITLLRSVECGGNIEEVKRWQISRIKRRGAGDDLVQNLISNIQEMERERLQSLKQLNDCRSRLKVLQKSLAPSMKRDEENDENNDKITCARKKVEELKRIQIPNVTNDLDKWSNCVGQEIVKLGNEIDEANFFYQPEEPLEGIKGIEIQNDNERKEFPLCIDPLYCIGGYEKVKVPVCHDDDGPKGDFVEKLEDRAMLCDYGSQLSIALTTYARAFIEKEMKTYIVEFGGDPKVSFAHVPPSISIPTSLAHSAIGCNDAKHLMKRKCQVCVARGNEKNSINLPSQIVLSRLNQNKQYPDKKLPRIHLCTMSSLDQDVNGLTLAHHVDRIDIFAISACNIQMSRMLQDEIARSIIELFMSLLTVHTSASDSEVQLSFESRCHNNLRSRCLDPYNLEQFEARRVTVEGYLPSSRKYIVLANVSNSTDFISRAFKIKCGGCNSNQVAEFAHLVHGTVCDMNALSWMMENNVATMRGPEKKDETIGVAVPVCLSSMVRNDESGRNILFLPFIRTISRGKGGKIKVVKIKGDTDPKLISTEKHMGRGAVKHTQEDIFSKRENKLKMKPLEFLKPPSNEEIAAESSTNPYNFLPFF